MADTTQQLTFKLVLDGKEAVATLDATEGKFIETEQALDKVAQQGKKIAEIESYVQNLGKDFDGVNVSVKDLIERHTELQNKLKSENIGGEAYQRWAREIAVIEQELDKATAKLQITQLANEGLITETMKYASVNEQSINSLSEYITSQNLSTETIENSVRALELEIKTLAVNSDAWKQKVTASVNLRSALSNITAGQSGFNSAVRSGLPGTNQMNMAIMQFGYALNDAQMFMVNARMGMMGIANNIPMIVQNFMLAKNAAGESATALQLITKSIMGGGGLIIGINALMFAMQFLPGLLDSTKGKIQELTNTMGDEEKKVRQQQIEFNNLITILGNLNYNEKMRGEAYDQLKEKYPEYISFLKSEKDNTEKISEALKKGNEQFQLKIALAASERILKEYYEQAIEGEYKIQKLQTDREEMQKQFDAGNKSRGFSLRAIDDDITSLTEKREGALKNIQLIMEKIVGLESQIIDPKKGSGNPVFDKADKELTALQEHNVKMAEIEGKSDTEILLMKKNNLVKRIELYEKYKQDVTGLLYDLAETEAQLQKSIKPPERPEIKIEGQPEDLVLKDIKDRTDYENSLQEQSLSNWYTSEDKKIQAYENYTDLKLSLDKEYAKRKEKLEQAQLLSTLSQTGQMLGQLSGMFGKQTAAYKVLATAQVWIETYKAVAALYAPPPVGVGPVLAPFMTAAVLAMGALQTANIASQKTDVKGFATGGRLPEGKTGFIEGTHNELIAPEEDFKSIFKTYSAELVKNALFDAKNYISINSNASSNSDLIAIKEAITKLNKHLDDGINARAYLDDREAKKVQGRGSYLNRKSKL